MAREYELRGAAQEPAYRIDYAGELNVQQHAAVTAGPGPALVLAGAGSGKTRTLTYRVAYLMEGGVPAERILLLTFTNKAAREMMGRVGELLGSEVAGLWGGTFHSIGARILRSNAERLGYRGDFTILDREDSEQLMKACLAEEPGEGPSPAPKAELLVNMHSRAVNERRDLADVIERDHGDWLEAADWIKGVVGRYAERKQASNAMDFDDLLALWLKLLEEHGEVAERYRHRFQWVLVDEYQDTNRIQADLIDRLVAGHGNLMAVGDDSQSIYSWRGANFRNILDFPGRYPGAQVFKVEVNYRSTPEILAVANAAIAGNREQFEKKLTPARASGPKPVLLACDDGSQQAAFVAQRATELAGNGVPLSRIAVLYRSHFHALELQLELTRRGVPYVITSGLRFFEQAHIKDVTAWLRLVANPSDETAFKRIALALPGVGPKAAVRLWNAYLGVLATAIAESLEGLVPVSHPVARALVAAGREAPKKAGPAWATVAATVAELETAAEGQTAGAAIRRVVQAFYEGYARETFANAPARLDDLDQLALFGDQFGSLTEFLTQLALLTQLEAEAEQEAAGSEVERLRLSTVHQAKGLEFRVVFVIMLAEEFFPSRRSKERRESEEEERRLFYVAVTRAEDELYLTYPLMRIAPGMGMQFLDRSRFLREIPEGLVDEWSLRRPRRGRAPVDEAEA
ncbi:MAG: ATP-dependent helicase [Verrucomicrobiae bacterium]|nr:ATP-dependent helicase [Verrucomicrobiae bacterium]